MISGILNTLCMRRVYIGGVERGIVFPGGARGGQEWEKRGKEEGVELNVSEPGRRRGVWHCLAALS